MKQHLLHQQIGIAISKVIPVSPSDAMRATIEVCRVPAIADLIDGLREDNETCAIEPSASQPPERSSPEAEHPTPKRKP